MTVESTVESTSHPDSLNSYPPEICSLPDPFIDNDIEDDRRNIDEFHHNGPHEVSDSCPTSPTLLNQKFQEEELTAFDLIPFDIPLPAVNEAFQVNSKKRKTHIHADEPVATDKSIFLGPTEMESGLIADGGLPSNKNKAKGNLNTKVRRKNNAVKSSVPAHQNIRNWALHSRNPSKSITESLINSIFSMPVTIESTEPAVPSDMQEEVNALLIRDHTQENASTKRNIDPKDRERRMARMKSAPCQNWTAGKCMQGSDCAFSHEGPGFDPRSKQVCRFFRSGRCAKGESCPYSHCLNDAPCVFFHFKQGCRRGDACSFSHDPLTEEQKKWLDMDQDYFMTRKKSSNSSTEDPKTRSAHVHR